MNTYVVPLQCERIGLASGARQMVIHIVRTLRDDQYRRVSVKGKWMDTLSTYMSEAMISTILVPDDSYLMELAPKGGPPLLRVTSNLYAWEFPDIMSGLEVPRDMKADTYEMLPAGAGIARRYSSIIKLAGYWPFPSTDFRKCTVRCGYSSDLENSTWTGARTRRQIKTRIKTRTWTPKKVTTIQFRHWNLEKGVAVAFTRSDMWKNKFYYHLEIGFDMNFSPICILYVRPFHLAVQSGSNLSVWLTQLLWSMLGNLGFIPSLRSFWAKKGCGCLGEAFAMKKSMEVKRCKVCFLGISDSWYPMIVQSGSFDSRRVRGKHHECKDVWMVSGERRCGLKMCTNDTLPHSYGCVDIHLSLRPLQSLEWELEVKEVPLHTGSNQDRVLCNECVKAYTWKTIDRLRALFIFDYSMALAGGPELFAYAAIVCIIIQLVLYLLVLLLGRNPEPTKFLYIFVIFAPVATAFRYQVTQKMRALWKETALHLDHSDRNHTVYNSTDTNELLMYKMWMDTYSLLLRGCTNDPDR